VVTTTTHKSLRGPRGGVIACKQGYAKRIDSAVFPGIQGGPLEHIIAAKAVCFQEALQPQFKEYAQQIIKNSQALCRTLIERGFNIVGGMTENHLMTVDLRDKAITGKDAANLLDEHGITVNKNTVPNDPQSPFVTSGLRIGVPAVTTRGFKEEDMITVGNIIADIITHRDDPIDVETNAILNDCGAEARELCKKYPIYNKEMQATIK
jgi:glycine hydroxymethyltransferase